MCKTAGLNLDQPHPALVKHVSAAHRIDKAGVLMIGIDNQRIFR